MADLSREKTFRFKRFELSNCRSAMKIGTDGVLLGGWSDTPADALRALDVGCGTGLISLMIAQRFPQMHVVGVEIDADAADEAAENAANSPFADRVSIVNDDYASFAGNFCESYRFDLLVSNPPFFNETLKSPDGRRATARHESSLSIDSLFANARKLLSEKGIVALVTPVSRERDVMFSAAVYGYSPLRICRVSTVEGKTPSRILWMFTPAGGASVEETLVIRNGEGEYSAQYVEMLRDFYLNF